MNEWMLFECLDPSRKKLTYWTDAWVSDSSAYTASVANTWVNGPYTYQVQDWQQLQSLLPRRTDLCCYVMENLNSGMCLLLKTDINKYIKNINMLQDVGTAELQKVKKQGSDNHIKQLSKQTPYIFFHYMCIMAL